MAIRTGWLNDVDLTGRGWWDVAQDVARVGGPSAVRQLYDANFFAQFPSFSQGDRAALFDWIGRDTAREQAAADTDDFNLKSIAKLGIAAAGAYFAPALAPALLAQSGALEKLAPVAAAWLGGGETPSFDAGAWISNVVAPVDSATSWLNQYFDPAAALSTLGNYVPTIGGDTMDLKDTIRGWLAPLLSSGPSGGTEALQIQAAVPALGGFPTLAMGAIGPAISTAGRWIGSGIGAAAGVIRSVGGRILGIVLPSGVRVSRKAAVNLAKSMGITAAATALGIGAVELAEMVMQDHAKPRRGRGVTGAQLKTTRRTMRTVERMHRQIAGYCREAGVGRARRAPVVYAAPRALPFHRHRVAR